MGDFIFIGGIVAVLALYLCTAFGVARDISDGTLARNSLPWGTS